MTDYQATLDWLYALEAAKGMDFKLERVTLGLERLGNPQRRFPSIHIAGTNGKGSVAAMLHAILGAAGYRAGLYISPHLVRFTERIRVGSHEIGAADVVALADEVRREVTGHGIELTFFEIVTVMALLYFARQGVDVAVVEVGLGGRLDATNVIDPCVAVITTIGRDHTEFLGDDLGGIAREKGGIIKSGRPVVLGRIEGEAGAVVRRLAAERGAPVVAAGSDYRVSDESEPGFEGLGYALPRLRLALRGPHQRENAATALATLATIRSLLPVSEAAIRDGLASVVWPGRFEVLPSAPQVVLDGAHNVDGMRALLRALRPLLAGRALHALFAVMRDKEWRTMAELLAPSCATVTVTQVFPPRGQPTVALVEVFRGHCPVVAEPDPQSAWQQTRARAGAEDVVLVTGSLFLIGAVYPSVKRDTTAADAEARPPSLP